MLKEGKLAALRLLKSCGTYGVAADSEWRKRRLLIVAYHGFSLEDEDQWDPALYMSPALLRLRLECIRRSGCEVLRLDEALRRLHEKTLSRPSVVLTVDDGAYDFYAKGLPIFREFNYPVTVYLTSYYSKNNLPVFNVACGYILWKGNGRRLNMRKLTGQDKEYDLSTPEGIQRAWNEIRDFANRERNLSAQEKDCLSAGIAEELDVDYGAMIAKRQLHIMNPQEVAEIAASGTDVQLHTHRHRVPRNEALFAKEITENRDFIRALTGTTPRQFCYPSGLYRNEFLPWLKNLDIVSATTCDPGMVTKGTQRLLLPRLIDTMRTTELEFEGWLAGVADILTPRRTYGKLD